MVLVRFGGRMASEVHPDTLSEKIEDSLREEIDDIHGEDISHIPYVQKSTLYLTLSAIFGVQPISSRAWQRICLLVATTMTAAVAWMNLKYNWAVWKKEGKSLMSDLQCIFGIANAYACMLLFQYKTGRNSQVLNRIWGEIDRKLKWPNAFVTFEMVWFGVGALFHCYEPKIIKLATEEISIAFNLVVVLILAQYGAILNHLSSEITSMKSHLAMAGSSMMPTMRKYFAARRMIGQTNQLYAIQMVFVVCKVFLKSVVMGYFLITKSEPIALVVSTVVPEAAMLVYITMNCYTTQSAASMMNLELFRALRNHPDLHRDRKLALVLKMNKPLDFTAGSFLSLGNGLITSMVAAVTTYLVTLVDLSGE